MRIRFMLPALLPALLSAAACGEGPIQPRPGGEYVGRLDSPFSVEGAAVVELTSADLREVWAPGRVMVARGTSERTVRILLVNRPENTFGGPVEFRVRMAAGAVPPRARVVAVSGPANEARDFVGGYAVRFTRARDVAVTTPLPVRPGTPPPPISFARAVAPFFPGGAGLVPPETVRMDAGGNNNEVYDLGDLRAYLSRYPTAVPPQAVWSR